MTRECHVRFCEGPAVKLRRSTHPYLWTDEGWLYLAVVLDLYSQRVIGRAMSKVTAHRIPPLRFSWRRCS